MHDFHFEDKAFDLSNAQSYNLSIQVTLDGFSVFIQNPKLQTPLLLYHVPFQLSNESGLIRKSQEVLAHLKLTGLPFHHTEVLISTQHVNVVPKQYINERQLKQFFNLKPRDLRDYTALASSLNDKYALVFLLKNDLNAYFNEQFPGCGFVHEYTPVVSRFILLCGDNQKIVNLHVNSGFFYLSIFENKDIIYSNSFGYTAPSDVLFYLVSAIEATECKDFQLTISGYIDNGPALITTLEKYFKQTEILTPTVNEPLKEKLKDFPLSRLISLLTTY